MQEYRGEQNAELHRKFFNDDGTPKTDHKLRLLERAQKTVGRTLTREVRKVGRNDRCPCGSGVKFKKCCLDKVV